MADKKAERLINLTIALLATNRYLKKSEIFRTVDGYSGSGEAMDRMFERDKNELRSLGIDISIGDLDPLFDDEPGYRIFRDSYSFQLKDLEPADVAILSVAAKLWNDSVLGEDAQSSLVKLESLGLTRNSETDLIFSYRYEDPNQNLARIESAIVNSKTIRFLYKDSTESREVEPYKIFLWKGFWYFIGKDLAKNDLRSFKLSRIKGLVEETKKEFKPPFNFDVAEYLPKSEVYEVMLMIPEGKAAVLRNMGETIEQFGEHEKVSIQFPDLQSALTEILRHGKDVSILEPLELKDQYRKRLEAMANV